MKKYFAYGSCTNVESFRDTLSEVDCQDRFQILGVGILKDHQLAFTRRSQKWRGGVLDILESPGNQVQGLVYELPEEAISAIDKREGAPKYYERIDALEVSLDGNPVTVFTYAVVDKELEEVKPTLEYVRTVFKGMKGQLPATYIRKYLLTHCEDRFGMKFQDGQETWL